MRLSGKGVATGRRVVIDRGRPATDERIAELARELASAINSSESAAREGMRDYAIDVLRDAVVPAEPAPAAAADAGPGRFNPFAFSIPVVLVGAVLVPLFPPLGLTLAGFGIVVCLVGLAAAAVRSVWRRLRPGREPGSIDP